MLQDEQLADLFEKFASGNLDNQEREQLSEWASESPLNEEILKLLGGESEYSDDIKTMLSYDDAPAWKSVKRRSLNKTLNIGAFVSIVASLAIIITTLGIFITNQQESRTEELLSNIKPGNTKAEFILTDGSTYEVGQWHTQTEDTAVEANEQATNTQSQPTQKSENITIKTPEGSEYQYTLPDGSKVWLNAMSTITFPQEFEGNQRKVTMQGEVFFEVAKDADRPFIIDVTDYGQIKVLGTSFNVKAYNNEPKIETTLVEGKVWMSGSLGEAVELTPGMQATISRDNMDLDAEEVKDTEPMVAWKNGYFLFDNSRLDEICNEFSRWYNIEIKIGSEHLASKRYSLRMLRQAEFSEVLNMLVATRDMEFKISKNNVIYLN